MTYRQREGVVKRVVAGETILLPLDHLKRSVFTLNHVGQELWERLATGCRSEALAAWLAERYGLPAPQADADVGRFLQGLLRLNLIEEVPEDAPGTSGSAGTAGGQIFPS